MQKLLLSLAFFIILFSSCTKDRDTTTPVAIAITSTTSTAGTVGSVFNYTINTNTIATSYAASGLPAGLSIN